MIYWTTIFGHRKCSGWFRRKPECRRGYRNPPGKYWALVGLRGDRGQQPRRWRPPPWGVRIGLGRGVRPLFPSPSPSLSFPPSFLVGLGKGSLAPTRRRTPPLSLARLGQPASPLLLYIRGRGHLRTHLIYDILAVCGAPSTILHLDNNVAELRRSPASVEHHHHHHAVVLTKLTLNTRLDRSSKDIIKLNVCRTRRCHAFST